VTPTHDRFCGTKPLRLPEMLGHRRAPSYACPTPRPAAFWRSTRSAWDKIFLGHRVKFPCEVHLSLSDEHRDFAWRRRFQELGDAAAAATRVIDELVGLHAEQLHAHAAHVELDAELLR